MRVAAAALEAVVQTMPPSVGEGEGVVVFKIRVCRQNKVLYETAGRGAQGTEARKHAYGMVLTNRSASS